MRNFMRWMIRILIIVGLAFYVTAIFPPLFNTFNIQDQFQSIEPLVLWLIGISLMLSGIGLAWFLNIDF